MHWTEILAIILISAYVLGMIIFFAFKKKKGKPIASCGCGHAIKARRMVDEYHKQNGCPHCQKTTEGQKQPE